MVVRPAAGHEPDRHVGPAEGTHVRRRSTAPFEGGSRVVSDLDLELSGLAVVAADRERQVIDRDRLSEIATERLAHRHRAGAGALPQLVTGRCGRERVAMGRARRHTALGKGRPAGVGRTCRAHPSLRALARADLLVSSRRRDARAEVLAGIGVVLGAGARASERARHHAHHHHPTEPRAECHASVPMRRVCQGGIRLESARHRRSRAIGCTPPSRRRATRCTGVGTQQGAAIATTPVDAPMYVDGTHDRPSGGRCRIGVVI